VLRPLKSEVVPQRRQRRTPNRLRSSRRCARLARCGDSGPPAAQSRSGLRSVTGAPYISGPRTHTALAPATASTPYLSSRCSCSSALHLAWSCSRCRLAQPLCPELHAATRRILACQLTPLRRHLEATPPPAAPTPAAAAAVAAACTRWPCNYGPGCLRPAPCTSQALWAPSSRTTCSAGTQPPGTWPCPPWCSARGCPTPRQRFPDCATASSSSAKVCGVHACMHPHACTRMLSAQVLKQRAVVSSRQRRLDPGAHATRSPPPKPLPHDAMPLRRPP